VHRRAELTEAALDYVLVHGLVGLSLRPLAAAIGTSDRMLVYHFGSKEGLVADVLRRAQERLSEAVGGPAQQADDLSEVILGVWAALDQPAGRQVTRLYLDTCSLAIQDPTRWGDAPRQLREPWRLPLQAGLGELGVPSNDAQPLADLILATLAGLALERLTAPDSARVDAAAAAFAELLGAQVRTGRPPKVHGERARN
jgi:AcrR family transcriptional regulator